MLTNDNASMDSRSAMACLLIGQPSLRRQVKLGMFAALDQRIALRCTIAPMEPSETDSYISHHLAIAGRTDRLFSDDATALIHQVGRGLPRAVNNWPPKHSSPPTRRAKPSWTSKRPAAAASSTPNDQRRARPPTAVLAAPPGWPQPPGATPIRDCPAPSSKPSPLTPKPTPSPSWANC